jgi:hypothetical protein
MASGDVALAVLREGEFFLAKQRHQIGQGGAIALRCERVCLLAKHFPSSEALIGCDHAGLEQRLAQARGESIGLLEVSDPDHRAGDDLITRFSRQIGKQVFQPVECIPFPRREGSALLSSVSSQC